MCIIAFHLLLCNVGHAQQGRPFISNFPPLSYSSDAYNSSPQNWCIEEDVSGRIILANSSGILVYDGAGWQMVPGTEGKMFYKFAKDESGQLYTAGGGDLGFLRANEKGELEFQSLLGELSDEDREFGRIGNVVSYKDDIYFRSQTHLIRYSKGVFKTWGPKNKFIKLVSSSAGVFVSENSEWYQVIDDELIQIAKSTEESLPSWKGVFQGPSDTLLVASRNNGLYYLYKGELTSISNDMNRYTVKSGCEISANKIAIATADMGVVIIDNKGAIVEIFNESTGLSGNATTFVYYSLGNLWVAMHSGISLIEYPVGTSILDSKNGLKGFPISMNKLKDRLFVGTYENAYWMERAPLTGQGGFRPVKEELSEVFDVVQVGNKLLVANTKGVSVIKENDDQYDIENPTNFPCTALTKSSNYDDIIYVCYRNGIALMKIDNYSETQLGDTMKLPHSAHSLMETKNSNLWAAYGGISHIDFSKGLDNPVVTTLDSLNGLIKAMGFIEVSSVSGKVLFGTELGVYSYNHKTKKLVANPVFGKQFCDGSHMAYNLTEMRNGDVWITTNHHTGLLRKQADNSFIYDSLPIIRAPISDVWGIYEDDDNVVWICGTEAVVRYDPSVSFDYTTPYKAFIRGVVVNDKEVVFAGNYTDKDGLPAAYQPKSYIPTLTYLQNDITFKYGAAFYAKDEKLEYSVRLEGKDHTWSTWRETGEVNYTNLAEGDYTFKVRSKNVYGTISEEAAYSFVILPPWYRTGWAYTGFIICGLILLWIILKLNSARLVHDKKKLEGIVTVRTAEVRKQRDEITEQATELNEAYQRLVDLDIFKESMTSMIVHDLKNPLNSILNTPLDEADEDQLKRIKQSGRQMLTMVLNILDVYKYENSEMKIDKLPVEVANLIEDTLDEVNYLARQQGVEIKVRLSKSATVVGDADVLGRVIVNLMTNAIKYSATMSVVELVGSVVNEQFRLEVIDHGTGIESKHLDSIFDQFGQIKKGTDSGGVRSTGLGLTFCRMATEAHDGTIGVESKFGIGSKFWIEIPIPDATSVKDINEPIGVKVKDQAPMSIEVRNYLKPYALELEQIPYYKISTLRAAIKEIKPPENISTEVNKWVKQFKEAAALANREIIQMLIQDILNDRSEEL